MSSLEISFINQQREREGFLSLEATMALGDKNTILDPRSTLISVGVKLGIGNILYPNTIMRLGEGSELTIGNSNIFMAGSYLEASNGGKIHIGSENHFEGGVAIKANIPNAYIQFGDNGRYINQILQFLGKTTLGNGSQVIGAITVQNCNLTNGEGFKNSDPDKRGGLLKGYGVARDLNISQGKGIEGFGVFSQDSVFSQSQNHPPKNS